MFALAGVMGGWIACIAVVLNTYAHESAAYPKIVLKDDRDAPQKRPYDDRTSGNNPDQRVAAADQRAMRHRDP